MTTICILDPILRMPGKPWTLGVGGGDTLLVPGPCLSNEPMVVAPGGFGIRLEELFFMTERCPRCFTPPAHSGDDSFGLRA